MQPSRARLTSRGSALFAVFAIAVAVPGSVSMGHHSMRSAAVAQHLRAVPLPADAAVRTGTFQDADAVQCTNGGCDVFGSYETTNGSSVLYVAEQLHGAWQGRATAVAVPSQSSHGPYAVASPGESLSCPAYNECTGVGGFEAADGLPEPLAVTVRDGAVEPSVEVPLPADARTTAGGTLEDVGCQAVEACVAVGTYTNAQGHAALMAATDRAGVWDAVGLPVPGIATERRPPTIAGLACRGVTFCVVVGTYSLAGRTYPLVDTLSGGRWTPTRVDAPRGGAAPGAASAVACAASTSCVVVGDLVVTRTPFYEPFALARSGAAWSRTAVDVPMPPDALLTSNRTATLDSVTCAGVDHCLAAGAYLARSGPLLPMAAQLSGRTWRAVALAAPPGASNLSLGIGLVGCAGSAQDCVAAGAYLTRAGRHLRGFVEAESAGRWGATATTVSMPTPSYDASLSSISCPHAGACEIAGSLTSTDTRPLSFLDELTW